MRNKTSRHFTLIPAELREPLLEFESGAFEEFSEQIDRALDELVARRRRQLPSAHRRHPRVACA
jgi:hypothetical protein